MEFCSTSLLKWDLDEPASPIPLVARSFQITEAADPNGFIGSQRATFPSTAPARFPPFTRSCAGTRYPAIRVQLNAIDHIAAEGDNCRRALRKKERRRQTIRPERGPATRLLNKHYRENAFRQRQ